MGLQKLLKIFLGLFLTVAIVVGLTSINHPIILKWLTGSARIIGKPVKATIYTNGQINEGIKIYHTDKYWVSDKKANNYLLSLPEYDSFGMLKFININLDENWIGRPVGTSKTDYDFIIGRLLQSETGGQFTPFQQKEKGFDFDPQLVAASNQIKFNLPPHWLKFDSIRIELQ